MRELLPEHALRALFPQTSQAAPARPVGVLTYTVQDIAGKNVPLSRYKGRGLRILAFPANDFGQQKPATKGEIHQCEPADEPAVRWRDRMDPLSGDVLTVVESELNKRVSVK